jgi:hypothetical protein
VQLALKALKGILALKALKAILELQAHKAQLVVFLLAVL